MDKDKIADAIAATIGSAKMSVKQDTWATSQINTMVKYHNMNTKQLAKKVDLPEAAVKRFKKWYSIRSNRYGK